MEREQLDPTDTPDQKKAFNIGLNFELDNPEVIAGKPFRGVYMWPEIQDFKSVMLGCYNVMWRLSRQLHRAFCVDLSLPEDYFEDKLDSPLGTLRLLYYPRKKLIEKTLTMWKQIK